MTACTVITSVTLHVACQLQSFTFFYTFLQKKERNLAKRTMLLQRVTSKVYRFGLLYYRHTSLSNLHRVVVQLLVNGANSIPFTVWIYHPCQDKKHFSSVKKQSSWLVLTQLTLCWMDQPPWLEHVDCAVLAPTIELLPVDTLVRCCVDDGLQTILSPNVRNQANVAVAHGRLS